MKKLNLNKQKVVSLTNEQMQHVNGGGEGRSDRLTGDCAFSRKWGVTYDATGPVGCYPRSNAAIQHA